MIIWIPTEPVKLRAEYNPNAPIYTPKLFVKRDVSDTCPTRPPDELIVGTLTQEWSGTSQTQTCPPDEETKRTPNFQPLKKKISVGKETHHPKETVIIVLFSFPRFW